MRLAILPLLPLFLSGCQLELELAFEQNGKSLDIKFYRSVLGIKIPFEIDCLTGARTIRNSDRHLVWETQRETSNCYSGSKLTYGQMIAGYSRYFEPLEPGKSYTFSVFGPGASGSGEFVQPANVKVN